VSTVSLQVFNTASTLRLTKALVGLPATGLAEPLTFTGDVTCGTQGTKPWTVLIRAGASSATATGLEFYDGESCTVTEDDPPPAPAGYTYAGAAAVAPAQIDVLGPAATVRVTSTTVLVQPGQAGGAPDATPTASRPVGSGETPAVGSPAGGSPVGGGPLASTGGPSLLLLGWALGLSALGLRLVRGGGRRRRGRPGHSR
jgi:hypothetical protein